MSNSPLVQRRRLRAELKKAREDAELTQDAVAQEMDWSLSKVIRIETGDVSISKNDLVALLRFYGIRDSQRTRDLIELGRVARQPAWWSRYRDRVSKNYFQYIEYETSANIIRSHETICIPGLLQTAEYAATIARRYRVVQSPGTIRALVEIRMKRQELLIDDAGAPRTFFILDEAVIRRLLGEEAVACEQVSKLLSMAAKPRVTLEIVPFAAGLHRGMFDDFSILEFESPGDSDVLYFEGARDQLFSRDDAREISIYRELFEDLRKASLGPDGTRDYLLGVLDDLK